VTKPSTKKILEIFYPNGITVDQLQDAADQLSELEDLDLEDEEEKPKGRFASHLASRLSSRPRYWKPGEYRVRIKQVQFREGLRGSSYIVECDILESSNPEIKPGDDIGHVIRITAPSIDPIDECALVLAPDSLDRIASFLRVCFATMLALEGKPVVDPNKLNVEEKDVEVSYCVDQPLTGVEIGVEAVDIVTASGKPFTKVVYKVLPENLKAPKKTKPRKKKRK
jgi:hypothetical protein